MNAPTLAGAGLALFPFHAPTIGGCTCGKPDCTSVGKHPLHTGWQAESTADPAGIAALFAPLTIANIGVDPEKSGVVVIDEDPGHRGDRSIAVLEAELGPLPPTPVVLTSADERGVHGKHRYYRAPQMPIASSIGRVAVGVDIKAVAGAVAGVGSQHASGHVYVWAPGLSPVDVTYAELPEAWAKRLRDAGRKRMRTATESSGSPVQSGGRNDFLASLAGTLKVRGFTGDDLTDMILLANERRCSPSLPESEVRQIASSIDRYETQDMGEMLAAWRAEIERDLEQARKDLVKQKRYSDTLLSDLTGARNLAEERRHDINTISGLCASPDLDQQFKVPAIAMFIAGKHDAAFADAYERPVDLYYAKITELTGLKDAKTIKKTLEGLDAGNLITTVKIPCSTKVIGKNGKPLQGFRYQVQFGPREGEAALTLTERANLLRHPSQPELRPKGWGQKRPDRPRCEKHPDAALRREWYCETCGDQVHEDTVAAMPGNHSTTPCAIRGPLSAADLAMPPNLATRWNDSTSDQVDPLGWNDSTTPCACGTPLAPGEACMVCDVSACRECGEQVAGTLSRYCRAGCRNRPPDPLEHYDSAPAELVREYAGCDA